MPAELGEGGVEAGARCAQPIPPGSNLIPWQLKSTCLLVHMHSHTHHHPDGHAVLALAYSAAAGCCAACARRELAPLALYAHPEAYSDFKQTMQVRCCCVPAEQWHASCKFLMHSPMPFSTHNTHVLLAAGRLNRQHGLLSACKLQ